MSYPAAVITVSNRSAAGAPAETGGPIAVSELSRGLAGVVDPGGLSAEGALVVNLPGSPKAVASGMPVILSVARHVIDQLAGVDH